MPDTHTYPGKRRGMRPGQRNSGQFKKGHDERRANRVNPEMRGWRDRLGELCRENVHEALNYLTEAMTDTNRPDDIRLAATDRVLQYGWGKPIDRTAHLVLTEPQGQDMQMADGDTLTDDQLKQIASSALEQLEAPQGLNSTEDVIEGEIVPKVRKKSTDN